MSCENDDFLRPHRPFPNDPRASYEACAKVYEAHVNGVEELTPERMRDFLIEAARGYQSVRFFIRRVNADTFVEDTVDIYRHLHKVLAPFLPPMMLTTLMGGGTSEAGFSFSVQLYEFWNETSEENVSYEALKLFFEGLRAFAEATKNENEFAKLILDDGTEDDERPRVLH